MNKSPSAQQNSKFEIDGFEACYFDSNAVRFGRQRETRNAELV